MILLEEYSQCDDDELREFCIQACEAFVQKCPEAIAGHIPLVNYFLCMTVKERIRLIQNICVVFQIDCEAVLKLHHIRSQLQL